MIPIPILEEKGAVLWEATPGEHIFKEGQQAQFYYQLESGRVRWCQFDENGKEILHKLVGPGEGFGYFPLFDGQPYGAHGIADIPCRLFRLRNTAFHEILGEHPEIQASFQRMMVADLRFKFFLMNSIVTKDPQGIMDDLLNYFDKTGKLICRECTKLQLTRQQLANMSGLRVETVVRAIKSLQNEERLCIRKGKVFIQS